jgi:hypothetical protein
VIAEAERRKMLAVRMCGPRVVARLESIGVRRLADLRGRDPWQLMHEINLAAGRPIWQPPMAIVALENLIDAAALSDQPAPARPAATASAGEPLNGSP